MMNKTKFEEDLSTQSFLYNQDPQIRDQEYLQNYENLLVNSLEINEGSMKLNPQQGRPFFTDVLFLPSYFYKEYQALNILIEEKNVNLLDCMYTIRYDEYNSWVIITLQDFKDNRQIHTQYQFVYTEPGNQIIENYSASILGGKYLVVALQQLNRILIKVFNLDLTLEFEYIKKFAFFSSNIPFEKSYGRNFKSNCMDYCEPGLIYYLNKQFCIRIDLNSKSVIERYFEEDEERILIRLLPITNSEFNYYFKNSKKESKLGYVKSNEDKLVLFVIFKDNIYQLNMFNLEIIRVVKQCKSLQINTKTFFFRCQVDVIPLNLKHRQRKQFSQWTFIYFGKNQKTMLFDWRESNLFQYLRNKEKENNFSEQNYLQRVIQCQDGAYILEQSGQYFQLKKLEIFKQKGCKNFTYTLKSCYNKEETHRRYFSDLLEIKYFCSPILYKGELTFPCMLHSTQGGNEISKLVCFNSFRKQAEKQISLETKPKVYEKKVFTFDTWDELGFYYFLDYKNENYIYLKKDSTLFNSLWTMYEIPKEKWSEVQCYFENPQFYSESQSEENKEKLSLRILQRKIIMFSEMVEDKENNQFYLPIIFKYGDEDNTCFGVIDLKMKKLITQTIHYTKYTKQIHAYYDEKKMEFIVLLSKQIIFKHYFYFYRLKMINLQFQFVNLIKYPPYITKFCLFVQNEIYNIFFPQNILIQFNKAKKFEILNYTEDFLTKLQLHHSQTFEITKLCGDSTEDQKLELNINYRNNMIEYKTPCIYNIKNKQLQFLDNNLHKQ